MGRKLETANADANGVNRDSDHSNDVTLKDIVSESQFQDVTHTIALSQQSGIAPDSYLSNPSQVGENFQLLAIVPDDGQSSEYNQMFDANQSQQSRGKWMKVS